VTNTATANPAYARPAAMIGGADQRLDPGEVHSFIVAQLEAANLDGQRVCVLVPDGTRSCPLPLLLGAVHDALHGRVRQLTVLIALGTHAAMDERELSTHLGYPIGDLEGRYPGMTVRNHDWNNSDTFVSVGSISAQRVAEVSSGRMRDAVDVRLNRGVVEHDVTLIVGPVFPHEVVGFSGGNKYFFPGVSGPEVIEFTHWLGALITSPDLIGMLDVTPTRALIDEAAALIPRRRLALCVVAESGAGALHAVTFGEPEPAWARAAQISSRVHIRYLDAPVQRVLSLMPAKYDDMWTAAKGFYKVEPVVADGGEVVIYAPHITEISRMHPEINQIGYHCRDYFVAQWDRFRELHWGVLAHSTHLRGAGTYDAQSGERFRVRVTLATGIPAEVVRAANLDYLDPRAVDVAAWQSDPQALVVPDAGEVLFRLA
jgi:nickel-dependent lactate racemase